MGPPPPPGSTSAYTETDTATATDFFSEFDYGTGNDNDGSGISNSRLTQLYSANNDLFQPFFSDIFSDAQAIYTGGNGSGNSSGGSSGSPSSSSYSYPSPESIMGDPTPPLERWSQAPGHYPIEDAGLTFQFPGFDMCPNEKMMSDTASLGIQYAKQYQASIAANPPATPVGPAGPSDPPIAELGQFRMSLHIDTVHNSDDLLCADYLYLSAFLTQMPIAHAPTWDSAGKPYVLLRAVKACGALFVRTKTASNFVEACLGSAREFLMAEFVSRSFSRDGTIAKALQII